MDWISDQHLSKLVLEEDKEDLPKLTGMLASNRNYTQEKCIKVKSFLLGMGPNPTGPKPKIGLGPFSAF